MEIAVLTWNLYHGRDRPPNPELFTSRSRIWRRTERDSSHLQVNRDLRNEFTAVLRAADWDVALLQECPPRWSAGLAATCEAAAHRSLTSRNSVAPVRRALARLNPDLVASAEGGSNLTLSRRRVGSPRERRGLVLRRRPERRTMAFTRLEAGLCVANLHCSTDPALAAEEVATAARTAVGWAGGSPLVLGGDFNVRPARTALFADLEQRFGLARPTAPDAIDHLLARGLETVAAPRAWPPEDREVAENGLAIRLSDHAPVGAQFRLHGSRTAV